MNKRIQELNVLIVEDENQNIEALEGILLNNGIKNINTAKNTVDAIDAIENSTLDIVLLDLKIPYEKGGVENENNAVPVIKEVELQNRLLEKKIKIIIISATTSNHGIQKIIQLLGKTIVHVFDKGEMGKDPDKFSEELINQIKLTISRPTQSEKPSISLAEFRKSQIEKLKTFDNHFYNFFLKGILIPFEKIEEITENNLSFSIIIKCGVAVEYLIDGFSLNISEKSKLKLQSFSDLESLLTQPMEEVTSIRDKLTKLTGRHYNKKNNNYSITGETIISRQAAEYSRQAYSMRNDASHSSEIDKSNRNIFFNSNFSKNSALISISLIMPLVQEYIKFRTNKAIN